jgi:phosphoserine phosphatase RsbU/P
MRSVQRSGLLAYTDRAPTMPAGAMHRPEQIPPQANDVATSARPAAAMARLSHSEMETILAVTRALAAPFDLPAMLAEVTAAARRVLHAERASVWLLDRTASQLVLEVASDIRHVRLPVGTGLVGACARDRQLLNVPDCYADPRFDPGVDKRSGFHTRCSLTLPLVDHRGELVGVMQLLNKAGGVFTGADETLAEALAAQCAVALARVRLTDTLLEAERMRHELELARSVQLASLPSVLPVVAGYSMAACFKPESLTGGDTYDLAEVDGQLLIVMADAAGHGIAPALSVTQMHAMLRMAFRLGASLEVAFTQVNDQLAATLPDGRFVTAFIGLLDPVTHCLRFLSGGQGPILHYRAASQRCEAYRATSFPMGAMPIRTLRPAVELLLEPGDRLVLLSDGIYDYEVADATVFGVARVEKLLHAHRADPVSTLPERLLAALHGFAGGAPQLDDITMVLVQRDPAPAY